MATAKELRAKLVLEATTKGGEKIEIIAEDLEKVADAGGEAAPKFKKLADEMRELGKQQALIDQFTAIKTQTAAYAAEAAKAQAETKGAALALKEKKAALAGAAEDEQRLSAALERQRQAQADISGTIKAAKEEIKQLRAASKDAGEGAEVLAKRLADSRAQLTQLQAAARESGEQTKALAREQRDAGNAMRLINGEVKALESGFDRSRAAAGKANQAYAAGRVELQRTRDAMAASGVASSELAAAQVRVRQGIDQTRQAAKALAEDQLRAAQAAQQAAAIQQTSHRKMAEKVQSISKELALVRNAYIGLQTLMAAGGAFGGVIQTADAYGQMAERIRMATTSQEEYELVQARVLESANVTYRNLAEQQEMYIRSAEALKTLGYDTQQTLDITDSFSYLLATNAASAERGASAIDAYTKSMQSGRVESDAWQSILAATPTIVDAIAKATGKASAEIRALGVAGRLSVTDLNEGLRQSVEANKAATEGMVTTVNDAMTRLKNTWSVYLGEANRANGSTQKMVGLLNLLAENLDTVVNTALTAGSVMAAVWGARALQALTTYIGSLRTAAIATRVLTTESLKAATAAERIGLAGKLAAAGWIGWEIGSYLRDEFEVVEKAGIALASGLHKSAAYAKAAWESLKGGFSDNAIEGAQERLRVKLQEIDAEYAALFESAGKAREQQDKQTESTGRSAAAAGNAVTQWVRIRDAYKDVGDELERQDAAMDARNKLREAEVNAAVALAQAIGTETEQRQAQMQAAVAQAAIAERVAQQRQTEVNVMIAERDSLAALGEEILKNDPIRRKELETLKDQIQLRQKGADAAMVQAGAARVAAAAAEAEVEAMKDNSARVAELSVAYRDARDALASIREAYAAGKASAEDLAKAEIRLATAARMHRDAVEDQKRAIEARKSVALADLDMQSAATRLAIEQKKSMYELAKARGDDAAASRAQNEQRRLEVQLAELAAQAKAAEAKAAMETALARKNELVTAGEYEGVKKQEVEAAIKGAEVKAKEAEIAQAAAKGMRDLANAQGEAAASADDLRKAQEHVTATIEYTWVSAAAGLSKYRDEAVRHAEEIEGQWQSMDGRMINSWAQWNAAVNSHFAILTRLADEHVAALERVDARQQQLDATNGGAARGVEALRMRLIELNGTEDEIAAARLERDKAEVRRQIELQKLEIERATIRGESAEAFQREIDLLNEQLTLMDRVAKEEKKQSARERSKNTDGNASGGAAGGGGGGGGGISASGGHTIVQNNYGINDPVTLARKLVPELKKLDRLAR